jgi:hypothetical protein
MLGRRIGFWFAVAGVAAITPTVINLAAKLGQVAPGLKILNSYNTRANG